MTSASSIPLSSTLRVLSQNINGFQTKITMRKRKQKRIVALGSLPSKSPTSSRWRIVNRACNAYQSTGMAWTDHFMKKDGEEWHWRGKHPSGRYNQ